MNTLELTFSNKNLTRFKNCKYLRIIRIYFSLFWYVNPMHFSYFRHSKYSSLPWNQRQHMHVQCPLCILDDCSLLWVQFIDFTNQLCRMQFDELNVNSFIYILFFFWNMAINLCMSTNQSVWFYFNWFAITNISAYPIWF